MKQPRRITNDDIIASLNRPEVEDFDGDADSIIDLAIKEAGRRLRDEPEHFGETALVNLVKEANKAAERREAKEKAAREEEKHQTVLDVVTNSPLPADRKRELIENEISRLKNLITELEARHG